MGHYRKKQDIFNRVLRSTAPTVHVSPFNNMQSLPFQGKLGSSQIMTRMKNENVVRANHGSLASNGWDVARAIGPGRDRTDAFCSRLEKP